MATASSSSCRPSAFCVQARAQQPGETRRTLDAGLLSWECATCSNQYEGCQRQHVLVARPPSTAQAFCCCASALPVHKRPPGVAAAGGGRIPW